MTSGAGTMHVFTYGSLMFAEVWRPLVTGRYASMTVWLADFARQGVRGATYPGIVAAPGAQTRGRLYLDVAPADLASLDAFEGDEYRRQTVAVELRCEAGPRATLEAQAYVLADPRRLDGSPWDVDRFAREWADGFYQSHVSHGPPRASGAAAALRPAEVRSGGPPPRAGR